MKSKTDEQGQYFFTLVPITKEQLRTPPALHHYNPWVNTQQQEVHCTTNPKTMTFNQQQTFACPDCITLHEEPSAFHGSPCAISSFKCKKWGNTGNGGFGSEMMIKHEAVTEYVSQGDVITPFLGFCVGNVEPCVRNVV